MAQLWLHFYEFMFLFCLCFHGLFLLANGACVPGCRCSNWDLNTLKCTSEVGLTEFPLDLDPTIQFLRFPGNKIEELPSNLSSIVPDLQKLDLSSNKMKSLPDKTFAGLKKLNMLSLADNELTELGQNIFEGNENTGKLLILLYGNRISKIHPTAFNGLQADLTLRLQQNLLKELHKDTFAGIRNVHHINLGDNVLERIDPGLFRDQHHLFLLDLDGNKLTDLHIDTFKYTESLETLNLEGNLLATIPDDLFRNNIALKEINLRDNKFTELPINLHLPEKVETISFSGNPLLCDCPLKKLYQNADYVSKYKDLDDAICANDPDRANVKAFLTALNCETTTTTTTTTIQPSTQLTNGTSPPAPIHENSTTNERPITTITKTTVTHVTLDKTSSDKSSWPIVIGCLLGILVLIVCCGLLLYLFRGRLRERCVAGKLKLRRKKLSSAASVEDFKYHDAAGWKGASTAMLKQTEGKSYDVNQERYGKAVFIQL
ncbi:phospholipase A2 inhibitor-like [Clytia hemisphaerica]|uniref:Uncharacterized protein n=1 Tax=Clytia hemisphaerica TaxID=252671 RepID=A0A7M5X4C2_9CNID|eukprot:TCONS_00003916-protein